MSDEQDLAEALDDDKLGPDYPPDEPLGVDEPEVTPLGERTSESFADRDARHEPEEIPAEPPLVRPLQDAEQDVLDDEAQAVADAEIGRDRELDGAPPPAEEAALHIEDA